MEIVNVCEFEIVFVEKLKQVKKVGKVSKRKQRKINRFLEEKTRKRVEYERRKKTISKIRHRRLGKNYIEYEDTEIEESYFEEDLGYEVSMFDKILLNTPEPSDNEIWESFYDPFKLLRLYNSFESIWTGNLYIPGGYKDWSELY